MKISLSICVLALVGALTGCSSPDVIVLDGSGKPIPEAKIVGTSLSVGGHSVFANEKGEAQIPSAVQETKWISVYKDGYRPVEHVDVAQKKPIVVKMTKN